MIGVLIRAMTYATLFIGVVLVYLPAQTLSWAGMTRPERLDMRSFQIPHSLLMFTSCIEGKLTFQG